MSTSEAKMKYEGSAGRSRHEHGGNIYGHPSDTLDFSANINPLGMPSRVERAAMEAVREAVHYPQPWSADLCEQIAAAESRDLSGEGRAFPGLHSGQVLCGNGAAELIYLICRTLKPEGGICLAPSFAEYSLALRAAGSREERIFLKEGDGFALTADSVLEISRAAASCSCLFLCIPNNPTGLLPQEEIFADLLEICRKNRIWLILDACFADLCGEKDLGLCRRMIAQTLSYKKGIVLRAFTKSFAMPGLRLGYLLTQETELVKAMQGQVQPWSVSRIAQKAGAAALEEMKKGEFLQMSRRLLDKEKEYLLGELEGIRRDGGLTDRILGHAANFIFFHAREKEGQELGRTLGRRGILIRDCSNFPGLEKGYYRIAVRKHEENQRLVEELRWLSGS